MGYPGPNCSWSPTNRQPTNQWLPANHSPASSRLSGQALAVGGGVSPAGRLRDQAVADQAVADQAVAAQAVADQDDSTRSCIEHEHEHDSTAQPRSPSMPLRPQYSLAMTRSSGWQWGAPANPYRNDYKPRSRTSPCCTAASYDARRNVEGADTSCTARAKQGKNRVRNRVTG